MTAIDNSGVLCSPVTPTPPPTPGFLAQASTGSQGSHSQEEGYTGCSWQGLAQRC